MKYSVTILAAVIFILTSSMKPVSIESTDATMKVSPADQIIGNWRPSNKRSVIKIYKGVEKNGEDPNKYYGKIVWLKEPNDKDGNPRTDINNPDESKRSQKLKGMINMKAVEFVGTKKQWLWDNGTIYDPNNGSEYSFKAEISRKNPNKLLGKGYIGVSLFGREDTWTRMVKK